MFSDNYINLCAQRGKHVTTVAEELGYSRTAGKKWAEGSVPRRTTLIKIANYFGVTTETLMGNKKAPAQAGERGEESEWELIKAFLETLPPEQLRGILLAVGAPKALIAELDQRGQGE